jgi:hypothetical protein
MQFMILVSAKTENTIFLNKKKSTAKILSTVLLAKEASCIKNKIPGNSPVFKQTMDWLKTDVTVLLPV